MNYNRFRSLLLLLLVTVVNVKLSNGYAIDGVKDGTFKSSFSSSSASASASASSFSSSSSGSFSSNGQLDGNQIGGALKNSPVPHAASLASANANAGVLDVGAQHQSGSSGLYIDQSKLKQSQSSGLDNFESHSNRDVSGNKQVEVKYEGGIGSNIYVVGGLSDRGTSEIESSGDKTLGCCKGPFPGPTGSILESKPAPPGGGGPDKAWLVQPSPPAVASLHPTITSHPVGPINSYTGTGSGSGSGSGGSLSLTFIESLPGPSGSIFDNKPATGYPLEISLGHSVGSSSIGSTKVPNSLTGLPENQHQNKFSFGESVKTGSTTYSSGAGVLVNIIGKLPGPSGSIYDSKPAAGYPHFPNGAGGDITESYKHSTGFGSGIGSGTTGSLTASGGGLNTGSATNSQSAAGGLVHVVETFPVPSANPQIVKDNGNPVHLGNVLIQPLPGDPGSIPNGKPVPPPGFTGFTSDVAASSGSGYTDTSEGIHITSYPSSYKPSTTSHITVPSDALVAPVLYPAHADNSASKHPVHPVTTSPVCQFPLGSSGKGCVPSPNSPQEIGRPYSGYSGSNTGASSNENTNFSSGSSSGLSISTLDDNIKSVQPGNIISGNGAYATDSKASTSQSNTDVSSFGSTDFNSKPEFINPGPGTGNIPVEENNSGSFGDSKYFELENKKNIINNSGFLSGASGVALNSGSGCQGDSECGLKKLNTGPSQGPITFDGEINYGSASSLGESTSGNNNYKELLAEKNGAGCSGASGNCNLNDNGFATGTVHIQKNDASVGQGIYNGGVIATGLKPESYGSESQSGSYEAGSSGSSGFSKNNHNSGCSTCGQSGFGISGITSDSSNTNSGSFGGGFGGGFGGKLSGNHYQGIKGASGSFSSAGAGSGFGSHIPFIPFGSQGTFSKSGSLAGSEAYSKAGSFAGSSSGSSFSFATAGSGVH